MLRSTKREVRLAIRQYIKDCLTEGSTFAMADESFKRFYKENKRDCAFKTYHEAFEYQQQNMANECLDLCPYPDYYGVMRKLMKGWLQETDDEAAKFNDQQVEHFFWAFIYREYLWLLENESKEA